MEVASWSEDPKTKVGSVIVGPKNEVRSLGFNGLPRGIKNTPEKLSRENGEKYLWMEHAERNAIYNATLNGVSTNGCRIYSTLFPCCDCARAIIQSGIMELNTYKVERGTYEGYKESFRVSENMMKESGVVIRLFDR